MRTLAGLVAIAVLSIIFTYGHDSGEVIRRLGQQYREVVRSVVQAFLGEDAETSAADADAAQQRIEQLTSAAPKPDRADNLPDAVQARGDSILSSPQRSQWHVCDTK
jgi:hypothetical protein